MMGPIRRLYDFLARVLSLRVIVIVAALSVVALVITLGAWVWFGVTNDQYSQLDRRLDSVSSLGDISMLLRAAQQAGTDQAQAPDGNLVRTARIDGITVSIPPEVVLPEFGVGYANTTIDGVEYRVRTFTAGDALIAVGAPLGQKQRRHDEHHQPDHEPAVGVVVRRPFRITAASRTETQVAPVLVAGHVSLSHLIPLLEFA
jgi:hypothetical protein